MSLLAVPREVDTARLGALVWYTVREITRPTRSEIQRAIVVTGLPAAAMPRPIAAGDALRRTVRDLGTLPERTDSTGRVIRLLLREAAQDDKDRLVYRLVRETADTSRVELDYAEVGEVQLHKPSGSLTALGYAGLADETEKAVLDDVATTYRFNRDHYDSSAVRDMVGKALKTAHPVSVRPSGGVFFVGREHVGVVRKAAAFLASFQGDSRLYSVPVLDDEEARRMVGDSLEAQVDAEAGRVIENLRALLTAGRPSEAATEAALRALGALTDLTTRYEELLQTRIDGARAALEAAQAQARRLLETGPA